MRLRLLADYAAMETGRIALTEFLGRSGAGERGLYHAELVYEELVTNIIKYGYAEAPGAGHPSIYVTTCVEGDEIALMVEDDGRPFDPLTVPASGFPGRSSTAGGHGLRLVRKAAVRMGYERHDERNCVTVAIRRS